MSLDDKTGFECARAALRKNSHGFSLIELLIVVAIILVVAAIAVPNLMRSRIAAHQAAAVGSLRTLNTAEITYAATYDIGFSSMMVYLGPPPAAGIPTSTAGGLVDDVLAGDGTNLSVKSGYRFRYTPGLPSNNIINSYTFHANPDAPGTSGENYYFTDESGVIRQNAYVGASVTDSPIAG